LAGRDASTDLAVLKCAEATSAVVETSDVSAVKPGSLALVVGRTRASGPVAALGTVSLVVAERRTWTSAALAPYIRLDIGVQPTAVGGAAVDPHGIVIGDIFVALAGNSITRLEDVHGQLGAESIGKSLPLKFVRGGALQEANIIVGERAHGAQ